MKRIRIKSDKNNDFSSSFSVKGISYHVQTEEGSSNNPFITTTAYMGGIIVEQEKTPYPGGNKIDKNTLRELMKKNHDNMIVRMKKKHLESSKSKTEYIKEARRLVKRRKLENALDLIEDAHVIYPDDPFIMSFRGYLRTVVRREYVSGIEECKTALALFDKKTALGGEFYYHFFYLNLGKAHLAAGNRDYAVQYFRKGLHYDKNNSEIMHELIQLGLRKRPVLPFLSRNNVINKYLGIILSRIGLR